MIGTVGSDEKAALAKANGCTHTIVYTRENFVERVKELTGGKGVPVVYDGDRQGHVSGVARLPVAARPLRELRQRVGAGAAVRHPAAVAEGLAVRDAADALHVRQRRARASPRWPSELFELVRAGKIVSEPRQTVRAQGRGGGASRARVARDDRRDDSDPVARYAALSALSSARAAGASSLAVSPSGPRPCATQRVGRGAVQAHGEAQRRLRVDALREQRADEARQHVAGAGGGERRRCRWR